MINEAYQYFIAHTELGVFRWLFAPDNHSYQKVSAMQSPTANSTALKVLTGYIDQLQDLSWPVLLFSTVLSTLIAVAIFSSWRSKSHEPPRLFDPIPHVFNTLQFVLRNSTFMDRAKLVLWVQHHDIADFGLSVKLSRLVTSQSSISVELQCTLYLAPRISRPSLGERKILTTRASC
jgi:hypothetical protein